MNLRPLNRNIIVERIPGDKTTASGIVLKSSEEADKARVFSIGLNVDEVKENEVVLINWNKASKVSIGTQLDKQLYVVPIEDVIFVYE